MSTFIPKITEREKQIVKGEMLDEKGCIIFDGTTRLGEATAVLWRQCNPNFLLQTRLVSFVTTETHMTGDQLYRLLGTILLRDLGKQPEEVIGDARDSCSTNGVAERYLEGLCPAMARNKCISHVLVGTGQHIKLPRLGLFMVSAATLNPSPNLDPSPNPNPNPNPNSNPNPDPNPDPIPNPNPNPNPNHHPNPYPRPDQVYLIQLLTHSHAFKIAFKEVMGESMKSYSTIRWWSRFDLMEQLAHGFPRLDQLITVLEERGIGDATTPHLREIYDDYSRELRHELAMMMDLKCFKDATYMLEGDQLEGLRVFETIEEIRSKGYTLEDEPSNMPNLAAVLRDDIVISVGTKVYEYFGAPHNAWYDGKVIKVTNGANGLPELFTIKYSDGTTIDAEEHEVRRVLRIHNSDYWHECCTNAKGAFRYLENRITNNCPPAYHYKDCYQMWSLVLKPS